MRISSAVITTAFRKVDYLGETLESLRLAGFPDPDIFHDDDEKPIGAFRNWKRALRSMLHEDNYSDAILIFQDDIKVAKGLRGWIEEVGWPSDPSRIGVVSFYTAMPHHREETGWYQLPLDQISYGCYPEELDASLGAHLREHKFNPKSVEFRFTLPAAFMSAAYFKVHDRDRPHFIRLYYEKNDAGEWEWVFPPAEKFPWALAYGALAYLIPIDSARKLLDDNPHPESKNQIDLKIGEWCQDTGLQYWMHSPSLVQHVGEVSAICEAGLTEHRRAACYVEDVNELEPITL